MVHLKMARDVPVYVFYSSFFFFLKRRVTVDDITFVSVHVKTLLGLLIYYP
jgi:hypothetical protein